MGSTFTITAVTIDPSGAIHEVPEPGASDRVSSGTLFELLDRIDDLKCASSPSADSFPWYQDAFDYDEAREPAAADCHDPQAVLKSLQGVERELQRLKDFDQHREMLQRMKQVCIVAINHRARILTATA